MSELPPLRDRVRNAVRDPENITFINSTPLAFMHIMALSVFFVGFSWAALTVCVALYFIRVFALTAGYHRYFSHRSYKTSRVFQFIIAFLGLTAAQCGPLWWASHHRKHHQHSDTEEDIHSPVVNSFFWAHVGWIMCGKYTHIDQKRIQDFWKYPELRFLDRFHFLGILFLWIALFGLGEWLAFIRPEWNTNGWQFLAWGGFFSTVLVYHATFCINSLTHILGTQRYTTGDHSRNNLFTALITMGEGWHNNHHYYPLSTRQGFFWWEFDMTYYVLKFLSWFGLVWDLRPPHPKVYDPANHTKIDQPV